MFHGINLLVVISWMGEDEGYRTERERELKKNCPCGIYNYVFRRLCNQLVIELDGRRISRSHP